MPDLTDTHCHIHSIGQTDKSEEATRQLWQKAGDISADEVVSWAAQAGVTRLICVGCDLSDSRLAIDFAQPRKGCWASMGLHPHEAQLYADQPTKLEEFASLVAQPKVVAIGECGLDFYYHHSPKAAQLAVLGFQIELARKHNIPLIFHVRQAFDDFWPLFDRFQNLRGVMHSFTDSAKNLAKALERDLYIGVNGIATFAKDAALLEVYKAIPPEKLLLETDAPFLTPAPYRGKVNEPKYLATTADFLAELRGEDRDFLISTTSANASKLFDLHP